MTGLVIALAILLFFILLLFLRVKLRIDMKEEGARLRLIILGIPFTLFPRKTKKKKIKLKNYSPEAMRKKERKAEAKKRKKDLKPAPVKPESAEKESPMADMPLTEKISVVFSLVKTVAGKFFGYLRVDIAKIHINVATEDAAKTALLFAAVSQGVAALADLLDSITNVKTTKKTDICINPDFTSDKTAADIDISFSILVWQVLATLIKTAFQYFKLMNKK